MLTTCDYQTLRKFATFPSDTAMKEFAKRVLYNFSHEWPESTVKVFMTLAAHALKFPGVAWIKAENVCERAGVSVATFWRSIKRITEAGLLQTKETVKKGHAKGGRIQGANVWLLVDNESLKNISDRPDETPEMIERPEPEHPGSISPEPAFSEPEIKSFINKSPKREIIKTSVTEGPISPVVDIYQFDKSFRPIHIPEWFSNIVMYNSAYDIEKFWHEGLEGLRKADIPPYDAYGETNNEWIQRIFKAAWYEFHKQRAKAKSSRFGFKIKSEHKYFRGIVARVAFSYLLDQAPGRYEDENTYDYVDDFYDAKYNDRNDNWRATW